MTNSPVIGAKVIFSQIVDGTNVKCKTVMIIPWKT